MKENSGQGYEIVNIHGGESTIVPNFIEILTMIKDYGYPEVSLQTNARTLKDKEFTQQLIDLNVKTFVTSFHTTSAAEMADLANVDENWLEEIIEGIKNAKELGAKVRTNTVVYKKNVDQLVDIMKFIFKGDYVRV